MILSFIIPSRPGADLSGIKAQLAQMDLAGHAAEFFFVQGTLPPLQRNVAIRQSTGEFVFLLDDDLVIPRDLVPRTLAEFDSEQVAGIGGPNLTPEDDPPFAQLSGAVLESSLATGATSSRWRAGDTDRNATETKLHGCFLCFRGALLRRYLFVEDLFPNDENELMVRLRADGFHLYYVPGCSVQHKRRATLRSHLKQVFISGRGRGELIRRSGLRDQIWYLVPLGLLLYVLALPAVWLATRQPIVWAPLAAYGLLVIALGLGTWLRRRRPIFLWTGVLTAISHLTYGAGLIRGLSTPQRYDAGAVSVEIVRTAGVD